MAHSLRVVNYAVNGSGVGHLTRLVSINRWLRRYCGALGVSFEAYFLTTSEADAMLFAERFASFKMPSKTSVEDAGIDKLAYLALAKQWVWHSLALLRPDVLIVDTFPRGSFGELLGALDLCKKKVFVHRPVKDHLAARPDFQAMLPLYDLIVVPEHEGVVELKLPDAVRGRVRFTGAPILRERCELRARREARAELGIEGDRMAVFVSAGGGGDPHAEARLHSVVDALRAEPDVHVVVAAGPLYRGRSTHGAGLTWLTQHGVSELLPAMDVAVSAAGYNSFHELMFAGVPTVFLPQEKVADEQDVRAARAVACGAAVTLPAGFSGEALCEAIGRWRDPAARRAASEAARAMVPDNHARTAAAEVLRMALGARMIDAVVPVVDDALLERSATMGFALEGFFELMRELNGDDDPTAARAGADALVAMGAREAIPLAVLKRLVATAARKVAAASVAERAAAVTALLDALAAYGDWAGALVLLRALPSEKGPRGDFVAAVGDFVRASRAAGDDVYRAIGRLTAAQTAAGEGATMRAVLAACGA